MMIKYRTMSFMSYPKRAFQLLSFPPCCGFTQLKTVEGCSGTRPCVSRRAPLLAQIIQISVSILRRPKSCFVNLVVIPTAIQSIWFQARQPLLPSPPLPLPPSWLIASLLWKTSLLVSTCIHINLHAPTSRNIPFMKIKYTDFAIYRP